MTPLDSSRVIHPVTVRLTHWLNALATLVLLTSGLQIHNAYPVLPFEFPQWCTLGGWLGGALLWHFAAMWLLMMNGALYLIYGIVTGRLRRRLASASLRGLICELAAAAHLRLEHSDSSNYNSVQKVSYMAVIGLLMMAVMSGFAVWKPIQLDWLAALLGGFQGSRIVHFTAMSAILVFLSVHLVMSVIVPRTLLAMVRGH